MSEVEGSSRRWSPSRIGSAVILLLVILGAIAYGIYSLVNSGNGKGNQTASNSQLTSPAPNKNKNQSGASSATGTTSNNPKSSATSNAPANGTSQLSNTGPGDTALIGFLAASIIGTAVHYGWRKSRAN